MLSKKVVGRGYCLICEGCAQSLRLAVLNQSEIRKDAGLSKNDSRKEVLRQSVRLRKNFISLSKCIFQESNKNSSGSSKPKTEPHLVKKYEQMHGEMFFSLERYLDFSLRLFEISEFTDPAYTPVSCATQLETLVCYFAISFNMSGKLLAAFMKHENCQHHCVAKYGIEGELFRFKTYLGGFGNHLRSKTAVIEDVAMFLCSSIIPTNLPTLANEARPADYVIMKKRCARAFDRLEVRYLESQKLIKRIKNSKTLTNHSL